MAPTRNDDLLHIARSGLAPREHIHKKVIVVGAGMAGLVSAYELKRAGYQVTILEAQHRVGGRILTLREPFTHGLYGEAGAMRLPLGHKLTQTYIQNFALKTFEFTKSNANAFVYLNGQRHLRGDVARDPARLGIDLSHPQRDQNILQFWDQTIRETAARVEEDETYWDQMTAQYGDDSLYQFLKKNGYSDEAVTTMALLEGFETVMNNAFLDILQVDVHWLGSAMTQIVGGSDLLPRAFVPALQDDICFGAEVVALDYTENSVTIHYKDAAGLNQATADFAILAIPFSTLRFVDVLKPFSYMKQVAIRQLHYANAIKVMLQCCRRFWEEDDAIYGGASISDLPIRLTYYPEHGRETGRGVLMGCYIYGEDAERWAALSPEERITHTVDYVSRIHPQIKTDFEVGVSKVWGEDRFAGGAFAFFQPGQQERLYPHITAPEGPIYFAGEHVSLKHMWIEGAVESGLRAAVEIYERG